MSTDPDCTPARDHQAPNLPFTASAKGSAHQCDNAASSVRARLATGPDGGAHASPFLVRGGPGETPARHVIRDVQGGDLVKRPNHPGDPRSHTGRPGDGGGPGHSREGSVAVTLQVGEQELCTPTTLPTTSSGVSISPADAVPPPRPERRRAQPWRRGRARPRRARVRDIEDPFVRRVVAEATSLGRPRRVQVRGSPVCRRGRMGRSLPAVQSVIRNQKAPAGTTIRPPVR